jgi:phospholipid/cholesterol/gamma-HCH transport system permease protein
MQAYHAHPLLTDRTFRWLPEFGWTIRLFVRSLSPAAFANLRWNDLKYHCRWMGSGSLPMIAFSAIFISIALTTQVVLELKTFRVQNLAGMLIAIGLLRELGPLTCSLAWSARVAAYVGADAARKAEAYNDADFAERFILCRWIAGLMSAVPLSAFGLTIGFLAGGLYAPCIGVSSTTEFMDGARSAVKYKDLAVYFFKLILMNPTIAVFVGCSCGRNRRESTAMRAANAVAGTAIWGTLANLAVTSAVYLP